MLLRPYQEEALRVLNAYWDAGGGNPLVAMATATGKSVLLAKLICDIAERYPPFRALVLVHVRELLQQNLKHLFRLWPGGAGGHQQRGTPASRLGRADHLRQHPERVALAAAARPARSPARG